MWTHTRSQLANALKADPSADVTELRRQLKADKLEDYIKRVVDDAPALNDEQRTHLASLLRGAA